MDLNETDRSALVAAAEVSDDHTAVASTSTLPDTPTGGSAASHTEEADSQSAISPSTILNTASSMLPSMPSFLSSSSSGLNGDPPREPKVDVEPKNPLATDGPSDLHVAQTIKSYVRGHKVVEALSGHDHKPEAGSDAADAALPKVSEKDGQGPEVVYANGVPLDIAGYHQPQRADSSMPLPDLASEGLDAFGDRRRSEGLEGEVKIGGGCE